MSCLEVRRYVLGHNYSSRDQPSCGKVSGDEVSRYKLMSCHELTCNELSGDELSGDEQRCVEFSRNELCCVEFSRDESDVVKLSRNS